MVNARHKTQNAKKKKKKINYTKCREKRKTNPMMCCNSDISFEFVFFALFCIFHTYSFFFNFLFFEIDIICIVLRPIKIWQCVTFISIKVVLFWNASHIATDEIGMTASWFSALFATNTTFNTGKNTTTRNYRK